jgi:hypothetical protein
MQRTLADAGRAENLIKTEISWKGAEGGGLYSGGRGGIRTHERREPLPVFKTGALNHSATLPRVLRSLRLRAAAIAQNSDLLPLGYPRPSCPGTGPSARLSKLRKTSPRRRDVPGGRSLARRNAACHHFVPHRPPLRVQSRTHMQPTPPVPAEIHSSTFPRVGSIRKNTIWDEAQ